MAKGTLKIAEKCGVATAIFQRGQEPNEDLGLKQSMLGRMLICVANLFLAFVAILFDILAHLRHHHVSINAMDLVFLIWFAGGVGLFFRKRLAWVVSLLGVGATACIFAACFVTIVALHIYPNTDDGLFRDIRTVGFVVFALGWFTLLFALSLGLFIGLVKMRKELK